MELRKQMKMSLLYAQNYIEVFRIQRNKLLLSVNNSSPNTNQKI